jgi:hypothetical protein
VGDPDDRPTVARPIPNCRATCRRGTPSATSRRINAQSSTEITHPICLGGPFPTVAMASFSSVVDSMCMREGPWPGQQVCPLQGGQPPSLLLIRPCSGGCRCSTPSQPSDTVHGRACREAPSLNGLLQGARAMARCAALVIGSPVLARGLASRPNLVSRGVEESAGRLPRLDCGLCSLEL